MLLSLLAACCLRLLAICRRLRLQPHIAGLVEHQEHPLQVALGRLQMGRVHQPLADQPADDVDFRRGVKHVAQQPPRQRPAAIELARRGGDQLLELGLVPVLLVVAAMGHLPLQRLLGLHQPRVLGVLRDLVVLLVPTGDFHVVFVGQHVDVAVRIELRAARPAEDLVGGAGIDHPFFVRRALEDGWQHDRAGGQIDARCQGFRADGHAQQLALEEHFHDAAILGQQPRVVNADAPQEQLPQLGAGPLRPVVLFQFLDQAGLLAVAEDLLALDLLGHGPALVAVEAKDQGRRHPRLGVAAGHFLELLGQQRCRRSSGSSAARGVLRRGPVRGSAGGFAAASG